MSEDLFGVAIAEPKVNERTGKLARKTVPKGYATRPGTGPTGETCRTCEYYCVVGGHAKNFRKCGLLRTVWTHGPGTDILAKSPACAKWEKQLTAAKD